MTDGSVMTRSPRDALDPASGRARWVFDPGVDMSQEPLTNCRGVSSWEDDQGSEGLCAHRIILGTLDGRIVFVEGDAPVPVRRAEAGSDCRG